MDDYISLIDLAPTFIEAAGLEWKAAGMAPSPGRSLSEIFQSEKSGRIIAPRDHVLIGKERHDVGRPNDWGYPIRGIVKEGVLYLQNDEPTRWPAGNPETGYLNCDGGATKTVILEARRKDGGDRFWDLCFGKRPPQELYDLTADPDCLHNLAHSQAHGALKQRLVKQMTQELKAQDDPRMFGRGHIFEAYPYSDARTRDFYNRYKAGEQPKAGWVNDTDFEKAPVE